jgi:thiol:disulfide interchange protein DsbD
MQALSLTPALGPAPSHPPYLLLAFLGGLVLNLMPCVFPVLALKALAITRLGGHGVRREAFLYTAGVLAAMLLLGSLLLLLRAAGESAGWGFQFQHPAFIALMAWLMFALTLNLAGWFEFALPPAFGRLHNQHSLTTGFLAVLLATPCTAPFMGAAIAAALVAPAWAALGIFFALGLGLAAPALLLACTPVLARLLPRPGAWMLVLQRILALPMLATFLWLAWVLQRQTGPYGLLPLLAGAALLTLSLRYARILALCVLLLLPLLHASASAPLTLPGAAPYSAARLAALREAGRPVFIDLTAAWCVTCLINEATTLKNPSVQADFSARHVALLVGDWTNKDPQISTLLTANHRAGVPLYLYYPPGQPPVLLPQILDPVLLRRVIAGGGYNHPP